jgi:hypothetical protein
MALHLSMGAIPAASDLAQTQLALTHQERRSICAMVLVAGLALLQTPVANDVALYQSSQRLSDDGGVRRDQPAVQFVLVDLEHGLAVVGEEATRALAGRDKRRQNHSIAIVKHLSFHRGHDTLKKM